MTAQILPFHRPDSTPCDCEPVYVPARIRPPRLSISQTVTLAMGAVIGCGLLWAALAVMLLVPG
jgi:hypothetical protein